MIDKSFLSYHKFVFVKPKMFFFENYLPQMKQTKGSGYYLFIKSNVCSKNTYNYFWQIAIMNSVTRKNRQISIKVAYKWFH